MNYLNEEIGKRISHLRHENNLTQEQLAEKLDISIKHCSEVERGVASLSLERFMDLCEIFDTNLDFLIRGKSSCGIEMLPDSFIECVRNSNEHDLKIIREYLQMFMKIKSLNSSEKGCVTELNKEK